ncbi:MAG: reverse transcriptase domain-containing protein [Bacteroidia bacterium]|nr:reverse transcriptase domain-containing protein [Bacteroidia bacterium]
MKRVGNLFEQIISPDNLRLADTKARRGKLRSYGVLHHDKNREANIQRLHEMLRDKTYRTSDYEVFKIFDPKEREIYRLPYFPDRIVHHAIMNIMEPIWVSIFTADTYACIKERGIHAAMQGVKKALTDEENTRYCLKIDIRKYYPSIDHEILKVILRRKIKCADTLELLDHIIDSAKGVPIGNYLSQYFANLYLAYFDHWIKEEIGIKYYFRYADDMVFLHADKAYLHDLLSKIKEYLKEELNLQLKANFQVFPVEKRGIDFVGYVFRHTHVLLRKRIKKNFCKAVAKINRKQITKEQYKQIICSWLGWATHCNAKNLIHKILKSSNYESDVRLTA